MCPSAAENQWRVETIGFFNYLDGASVSSLSRNGKVRIQGNADGSDSDIQGLVQLRKEMAVYNGRCPPANSQRNLFKNGFELLERPLGDSELDFLDQQGVVHHY